MRVMSLRAHKPGAYLRTRSLRYVDAQVDQTPRQRRATYCRHDRHRTMKINYSVDELGAFSGIAADVLNALQAG